MAVKGDRLIKFSKYEFGDSEDAVKFWYKLFKRCSYSILISVGKTIDISNE